MDIFFCDHCAARVSDADLHRGHGIKKSDVVICGSCIDAGLGLDLLRQAEAADVQSPELPTLQEDLPPRSEPSPPSADSPLAEVQVDSPAAPILNPEPDLAPRSVPSPLPIPVDPSDDPDIIEDHDWIDDLDEEDLPVPAAKSDSDDYLAHVSDLGAEQEAPPLLPSERPFPEDEDYPERQDETDSVNKPACDDLVAAAGSFSAMQGYTPPSVDDLKELEALADVAVVDDPVEEDEEEEEDEELDDIEDDPFDDGFDDDLPAQSHLETMPILNQDGDEEDDEEEEDPSSPRPARKRRRRKGGKRGRARGAAQPRWSTTGNVSAVQAGSTPATQRKPQSSQQRISTRSSSPNSSASRKSAASSSSSRKASSASSSSRRASESAQTGASSRRDPSSEKGKSSRRGPAKASNNNAIIIIGSAISVLIILIVGIIWLETSGRQSAEPSTRSDLLHDLDAKISRAQRLSLESQRTDTLRDLQEAQRAIEEARNAIYQFERNLPEGWEEENLHGHLRRKGWHNIQSQSVNIRNRIGVLQRQQRSN